MTDQPTPETDAEMFYRPPTVNPAYVPYEFARAMEIQRNAARAERDAAKRNVAKTATEKIIAASGTELLTRIAELESANAAGSAGFEALRAERESLKTELDALSEAIERNCVQYVQKQQSIIAERDALRADVARLRDVLQRIVNNGGSATNEMLFDARTALAK
jgi:chromosome segregation ATPase